MRISHFAWIDFVVGAFAATLIGDRDARSVPRVGGPECHRAVLLPAKPYGLARRLAAPPPEQKEQRVAYPAHIHSPSCDVTDSKPTTDSALASPKGNNAAAALPQAHWR
jgi:hypothetical protein